MNGEWHKLEECRREIQLVNLSADYVDPLKILIKIMKQIVFWNPDSLEAGLEKEAIGEMEIQGNCLFLPHYQST